MKKVTIFLVLFCVLAYPKGWASLPEVITYQGHVVDSQGEPLGGPFDITFRIYDSESAQMGQEIWKETQAGVPIAEGDFSVKIGNAAAQSAHPLHELAFDKSYWLGIEIASLGELLPRQTLDAVPFAYRVHDGVTLSEDQVITGKKQFSDETTFDGPVTFSVQASGDGTVPSGMIGIFTTSCPEYWTYFSAAEGKFLVSGSTYNAAAGGSLTHAHSLSNVPNGIGWNASSGIGGVGSSNAAISTQVNAMTAEPADSRPPFATMVLCRKN